MWATISSYQFPLQRELQSGPEEGYKRNPGHVGQEMGLGEWPGIIPFDHSVPGDPG